MNKKELAIIFLLSLVITYLYIWWRSVSVMWDVVGGNNWPEFLRPFYYFVWWYPFQIFFATFLILNAFWLIIKKLFRIR